jgi:hypothetical protein
MLRQMLTIATIATEGVPRAITSSHELRLLGSLVNAACEFGRGLKTVQHPLSACFVLLRHFGWRHEHGLVLRSRHFVS